MKVKICGIRDVDTALAAVGFGADAIGFVFAESKRRITAEQAREISLRLPEQVFRVGVFVNETKEEIERIASIVSLTHIQLHGDESAEFVDSISLPVIKSFCINSKADFKKINDFRCELILLDGPKGKYRGGNGHTFSWQEVKQADIENKKIILAGGLTVDNVLNGIDAIRPYMVDVSSGVETEGKKDSRKIELFINKVKGKRGNRNEELYNAH